MSGEGVAHEHVSSGVGVQQALIGRLEEPLVGVEPRLEELIEELPENAAAVNASFVQAVGVEQVHADALLQVGLCGRGQGTEKSLKGSGRADASGH